MWDSYNRGYQHGFTPVALDGWKTYPVLHEDPAAVRAADARDRVRGERAGARREEMVDPVHDRPGGGAGVAREVAGGATGDGLGGVLVGVRVGVGQWWTHPVTSLVGRVSKDGMWSRRKGIAYHQTARGGINSLERGCQLIGCRWERRRRTLSVKMTSGSVIIVRVRPSMTTDSVGWLC